MSCAPQTTGKSPHAGKRIILHVPLLSLGRGIRKQKEAAVLGDKEKNQTIDQSEQLLIKVLWCQRPFLKLVSKILIGWMGKETLAKGFDCVFNTISELV
ncbi:MAG: hypothetical protein QME78_09755 [Thermodesulfobacteriota bacterium]|nr:hypothetical protein [Thermodesulfobacteriota bacterium]